MEKETMKTIFAYIGFPIEGDDEMYWIYDPETDKHYQVPKAQYDEVMKNANS